jgi:FMN phosphatase YigB (HAD superfamily)
LVFSLPPHYVILFHKDPPRCFGFDGSLIMKKKRLNDIKAVFFDLDGTLLQAEMNDFIPAYIEGLSHHFADVAFHYTFCAAVREGITTLLSGDDGSRTNEEVFFATLRNRLDIGAELFGERLARYCANGLGSLKAFIHPLPLARQILNLCRGHGLIVILATNPVFPRALVDARLAWGGIADFPFDFVTSFENTRYCKPNPRYFTDLLDQFALVPAEAIMVGNDTEHDLSARMVGIPTFLVDTWLSDRLDGDFDTDYRGGHLDLVRFLTGVGKLSGRS